MSEYNFCAVYLEPSTCYDQDIPVQYILEEEGPLVDQLNNITEVRTYKQENDDDGSPRPFLVTIQCQQQYSYLIQNITVTSNSRNVEVYSDNMHYETTCRGKLLEDDVDGLYEIHYSPKIACKTCSLKMLSLTPKGTLCLRTITIGLQQDLGLQLSQHTTTSIDTNKVRELVNDMGSTMPLHGEELLQDIDKFQKLKQTKQMLSSINGSPMMSSLTSLFGQMSCDTGSGDLGELPDMTSQTMFNALKSVCSSVTRTREHHANNTKNNENSKIEENDKKSKENDNITENQEDTTLLENIIEIKLNEKFKEIEKTISTTKSEMLAHVDEKFQKLEDRIDLLLSSIQNIRDKTSPACSKDVIETD